jgi:hypothetical protein
VPGIRGAREGEQQQQQYGRHGDGHGHGQHLGDGPRGVSAVSQGVRPKGTGRKACALCPAEVLKVRWCSVDGFIFVLLLLLFKCFFYYSAQ